MNKLFVFLNGGLGNQLFQYATGRALALDAGAELVLDTWSGFIRDFQYHRSYALGPLPIQARVAQPWERAPVWLLRIENKMRAQRSGLVQERLYGRFLVETELRFLEALQTTAIGSSAWLMGYWQSPLYFQKYKELLLQELMPVAPADDRCLQIGRAMVEEQSVAVGIRLYEDSNDPAVHARGGIIKSITDINTAINQLKRRVPNPKFYIFCSHKAPSLNELNIANEAIFVTPENGYGDTLTSLWLMSQCRHHIFTNSSYYWWGAWLSAGVHAVRFQEQVILAANNFINEDSVCEHWESF